MQDTQLASVVTTVLPKELIDDLGNEFGVVQRQRTVWLAPLVWVLVLGSLTLHAASLADFWRLYLTTMGCRLAHSSFYERLTPQLAQLIANLLQRALRANRRATGHWLTEHLGLGAVLAVDSSVIQLRDGLRQAFCACTKAGAALKVHAVVNVLDFRLHHVRTGAQTEHDVVGLSRVRQWCTDKLLLMDLGYYSFSTFGLIDECGGFFISRAKRGMTSRIVADHQAGQGAFTPIVGLKLKDALKRIKRQVLDVDVELVWREKGERKTLVVRAVGLWDEEAQCYRVYLTNLARASYPAAEIGQLYRMRWAVELLWKQVKSDGHLDRQTSGKEHIVQLRIDCVLLAYCITGRLCAIAQRRHRDRPYPVSRGLKALAVLVPRLLEALCEAWRKERPLMSLFEQMTRAPNDVRERAYDPLLRTSDLQWAP